MKIAVCLPSYNEAINIQSITKMVDQGLTNLLTEEAGLETVIVNVDSDSNDGTAKLFKGNREASDLISITMRK
jgi:glycosyltransferase involved in cell wall biosynthesis